MLGGIIVFLCGVFAKFTDAASGVRKATNAAMSALDFGTLGARRQNKALISPSAQNQMQRRPAWEAGDAQHAAG